MHSFLIFHPSLNNTYILMLVKWITVQGVWLLSHPYPHEILFITAGAPLCHRQGSPAEQLMAPGLDFFLIRPEGPPYAINAAGLYFNNGLGMTADKLVGIRFSSGWEWVDECRPWKIDNNKRNRTSCCDTSRIAPATSEQKPTQKS